MKMKSIEEIKTPCSICGIAYGDEEDMNPEKPICQGCTIDVSGLTEERSE